MRTLLAALLLCSACKKKESGFEIRFRVASSGEEFSAALEQTVGAPMRPGHRIEVVENGRIFDALTAGRKSDSMLAFLWAQTDAANCRSAACASGSTKPR